MDIETLIIYFILLCLASGLCSLIVSHCVLQTKVVNMKIQIIEIEWLQRDIKFLEKNQLNHLAKITRLELEVKSLKQKLKGTNKNELGI